MAQSAFEKKINLFYCVSKKQKHNLLSSSKTSVSLQQPRDERFWAEDVSAEGRNEAGDLRIQN